jgi:hypothetical protein
MRLQFVPTVLAFGVSAALGSGSGYPPFAGVYSVELPQGLRAAELVRSAMGNEPLCVATSDDGPLIAFFRLEDGGRRLEPSGGMSFGSQGTVKVWVQDLDDDGDDDLLVVAVEPGRVIAVLQEEGAFLTRSEIPVPSLTSTENIEVIGGDFDADGLVDIAVVRSGGVDVYLATGPWAYGAVLSAGVPGLFRPAMSFDVDGVPGDEIIGSRSDGVAVVSAAGGVLTQLASPNLAYRPEFVRAGVLRPGHGPEVLLGDRRTGSTRVDLLAASDGALTVTATGDLQGVDAARLAVADIDHDGLPDLLIGGETSGVYYGRDNGAGVLPFGPEWVVLSGIVSGSHESQPVRSMDVDGDGLNDFVGRLGDWFVMFLGDGERFRSRVLSTAVQPADAGWLVPYPSDDPRWPALLGFGAIGSVTVSATTPDGMPGGRLSTQPDPRVPLYGEQRVMFGDVNGDGNSDYVGLVDTQSSLETSYLMWAIGDGQGGYGVPVVRGTQQNGTEVMLQDLDGDGLDDAALVSNARVDVWLGRPSGIFGAEMRVPIPNLNGIGFLCDLDGDGHSDLVRQEVSGPRLQLLYGTSGLEFGGAVELTLPPGSLTLDDERYPLVDLNGDGVIDVIVATASGMGVAMSTGPRSYRPIEQMLISGGGGRVNVRVGDLDGDTYPEVLYSNQNGLTLLGFGRDRTLEVRSMLRGVGGFAVLHDIDNDGAKDIVVSSGEYTIAYINSGSIRCLADYAPDGVLNFFDITLFIDDLVNGVRFADLDRNGVVNFLDLALLVNRFGEGCPE